MASKPVIVIISGGWHQPESYAKLVAQLQNSNFEVKVPSMPSVSDTRPPPAGFADDTRVARETVESLCDAGRHVIVLMHSYGGHVGTNSLHGLGVEARKKQNLVGGVTDLVYMCAYALSEGLAMMDKVKEAGMLDLIPSVIDFAEDMSAMYIDLNMMIGPGVSEQEAKEYFGTLKRWNGHCLYAPLEKCAWKEMPVTYIHTPNDATMPIEFQTSIVEKIRAAGVEVNTYEIPTGHCPNLTATEEVVAIVQRVAEKGQSQPTN